MVAQNSTFLVSNCKPQFFKVLFPDPFANLMIPRKFHMNLPYKLKKLATLFSPNGKFWHVEINHTGQDIYFQKGWSEFAKAHDLHAGYFVVFRYEGNMIFKVKVFDTTGCIKDFSLGSNTRHVPTYNEVEISSQIRDQTSNESSREIKSDILKKRKLAKDQELETDKREKVPTSEKILQEKKKKTEMNCDSTVRSRQVERILRPYCFSHGFLNIPKAFCVNNRLLRRCTLYLRMSSSGGMSWPVRFYFKASHGHLGKGWKEFREAAGLKEGDRCILELVSKNSLVVNVIPHESNSSRERKGRATEGSASSAVASEEKQIQQTKKYSRPILEWESTVRQYHLTQSYQSLRKTFCLDNKLTSTRDVTLRDPTGKEWRVKFYMHTTEGRLSCKGWTEFSGEYGLKVGDRCIFKLIEKDTLLVRVAKT